MMLQTRRGSNNSDNGAEREAAFESRKRSLRRSAILLSVTALTLYFTVAVSAFADTYYAGVPYANLVRLLLFVLF